MVGERSGPSAEQFRRAQRGATERQGSADPRSASAAGCWRNNSAEHGSAPPSGRVAPTHGRRAQRAVGGSIPPSTARRYRTLCRLPDRRFRPSARTLCRLVATAPAGIGIPIESFDVKGPVHAKHWGKCTDFRVCGGRCVGDPGIPPVCSCLYINTLRYANPHRPPPCIPAGGPHALRGIPACLNATPPTHACTP